MPADKCYCGTSIAEARSLGCKFEPMSPAWLPPRCRAESLSQAFEKAARRSAFDAAAADDPDEARWRYFRDAEMMQEVSVEEFGGFADTGHRFYASYDWYV
jgi:hypothetical protein